MDRLAGKGVLFRTAYAPSSWTLPSTASMLTSLHPREHGAANSTSGISQMAVTLAERMHGAGYDTAAFSANYCFVTAERGFDRGFDHFELFVKESSTVSAGVLNRTRKLPETYGTVVTADAEQLNLAALKWLDDRDDTSRPVFMYLHYMDPHNPYEPPKPFDTMFDPDYAGTVDGKSIFDAIHKREFEVTERDKEHVVALYDGEIAYTDSQVGRLLDELDKREVLRNALVIITADHGEELFERGDIGHGPTLYEEVLRVPLIIWQKQLEQSRAMVDSRVTLLDIVPTVLKACGIQSRGTLRGKPLLPPAQEVGPDTVWAEVDEDILYTTHKRALIDNNWKIIVSPNRRELYNISADPQETKDLSTAEKEKVEALAAKADAFSQRLQRRASPVIELDDEKLRELESLGYVR
jgi:arylsulfatase A-like enzyme